MTATCASRSHGSRGVVGTIGCAHGNNELARVREEDIRAFGGVDVVDTGKVGHEERRELAIARSSLDVDVDAVLVHLAITDGVEPCPRQNGGTRLHALWNRNVPGVQALGFSR